MLGETSRVFGLIPQFTKIFRHRTIGVSKHFSSALPQNLEDQNETPEDFNKNSRFHKFRHAYPDFLPDTTVKYRNAIREKLERRDMLRRRNVIHIPEFYVGSVLAVTTSNKHAVGKTTRFVGICIMKRNFGLQSTFLLRNVVENTGVEILYSLYSPLILKIEVLRLEKRVDDPLYYLRDAPHEYSTFPFDMLQEYHDPEKPVPVNAMKVPINPKPWLERYERMDLKGVILPKLELTKKQQRRAEASAKPWEKYDLMDEYRKTIPQEEQKDLFLEVCDELKKLELKHKSEKKRKVFVKPTRQKVF